MTPEASLPLDPSHPSLNSPAPSLSTEALVEQFTLELQSLEPLCMPPPKVERQSLLGFRCEEFEVVNAAWKEGGIQAVIERWGKERTFEDGDPGLLKHSPTSTTTEGSYPIILAIYHFAPGASPNPVQMNYYRSRSFELSAQLKEEIREALNNSGILPRLLPRTDTITGAKLSEAPIEEITCACQWYGPDNLYGDGSVLQFTLTLCPPDQEPEYLRLSVNKSGVMTRSILVESLFETGYEGHDHLSSALYADELRALLPLIAKIHAQIPSPSHPNSAGAWVVNSFLPIG